MKVYVQMDYLANQGTDYMSASYRDFVCEAIEVREVIKKHLKAVVRRSKRITEIARGITNLEKIATQPIRTFIEHQLEEGFAKTPSYFILRERGLHVRKQTFLQYWEVVKEGWREEPEEEEEAEPEEYDDAALSEIHKWLTHELQNAFWSWGIERDYDIFIADEFAALYKTRTFEFGLIRIGNLNPAEVAHAQTYYYIVYNKGAVQAYEMWEGFNYMGFEREMRRIGIWE